MDPHSEAPTRVRYLIVAVAFLSALLLYLHRFCITYAQRFIKEDLGLTNDQLGYCFSAFFVAYALCQVPTGWLSDRYGARWMLSAYILVWSGFTALVGLTTGFVMFLLLRAAVGLGQAGAYPTSAALVARWMPPTARGKASSCVAFGGRVGGFMAPLVTVYMVIAFVPTDDSLLDEGDLMTRGFAVELKAAGLVQEARLNAESAAANHASEPTQQTNPESDRSLLGEEPDQLAANLSRFRIRSLLNRESLDAASQMIPNEVQGLFPLLQANSGQPKYPDTLLDDIKTLRKQTEDLGPAARNAETHQHRTTLRDNLNQLLGRRDLWDAIVIEVPEPGSAQNPAAEKRGLTSGSPHTDVWAAIDVRLLPLEREAKQLLRIENRTQQETVRLNRLVLEAAFPIGIKKLYVRGWRKVMFMYGAAGLAVAAICWWIFRERPKEHPWCNSAEQNLVDHGRGVQTASLAKGGIPIRAIVRSRHLWLICGSQFCSNIGWVFLMTWLPRYLLEVHKVPFVERGIMAAVPLGVGWIGMLLGGWLTDRVVSQRGLRWRTAPIVFGRYLAAAAYLSCLIAPNAWAATAAFALIAFSNDLCNPSSWAYKQDVGGSYVGAIHGWANMWGNLGAAISPILWQVVIRESGWDVTFLMGAVVFLISGTAALFVDARVPVVAETALQ